MKIRMGFVSNSSSSSFLVPIEELTAEQECRLKKYGFVQVETDNPFELYFIGIKALEHDGGCSYAYDVGVNQEDIAYLLAKEMGVPFRAAIHYGHWLWQYDRGADKIHSYPNWGLEVIMNGAHIIEQPRYYTINVGDLEGEIYET